MLTYLAWLSDSVLGARTPSLSPDLAATRSLAAPCPILVPYILPDWEASRKALGTSLFVISLHGKRCYLTQPYKENEGFWSGG